MKRVVFWAWLQTLEEEKKGVFSGQLFCFCFSFSLAMAEEEEEVASSAATDRFRS
jgi:hypothetical protein